MKTILITVVSVFAISSCSSLYLYKPQDPKCWDKNHPKYDSKLCKDENTVFVEVRSTVENKKMFKTKRSVASKRLEGRHFTEEELKQRRSQQIKEEGLKQKTHRFEPTTEGLRVGMTEEEVIRMNGWPKDINRTITKWGTHEQWVYKDFYLYFEDRHLTAIQD